MQHVRIDEGVKRDYPQRANDNPRNEKGQFKPLIPKDDATLAAALTAYSQGATLAQIAEQYEVSEQAIYSWLLGDMGGKEHADLVTQALTARIADADKSLDESTTPLELSRSREQARFRRMDFERRRAHLYGQQQQQINVNANGPVSVQVVSFAAGQQLPAIDEKIVSNQ